MRNNDDQHRPIRPVDCISLMDRVATIPFESFIQVVGEQFNEKVNLVRLLEVVFHATALIIEPPHSRLVTMAS
uniref:hypothetical protein n=1 Tax=Paenibacillus marchantiophytorum TaxID=1619310 RepID=UPI001669D877|nr:hypothetical protein [Paenibacillus marchantiophytorum]